MTHSGASSGGGMMMDVDAITGGIPSSSDKGDFTQQEENDLKGGTMEQSSTPYENESSLNREAAGASGSEDQQTDPDTINPWSVSKPDLCGDSELVPDGDSDSEAAVSMGSTGCSETPIETFNHQQSISSPASESAIALEEENLAKVETPKTANLDTINPQCERVSESGPHRDSELGSHGDPDAEVACPTRTTETLIDVETNTNVPNDQAVQIGKQSTAPMGPTGCSEAPIETFNHQQPISRSAFKIAVVPEEEILAKVGNPKAADSEEEKVCRTSPEQGEISQSNNGAQGDLRVDISSECAPPSHPAVAPTKPCSFNRRAQMEKSLTNANHLQPAGTNTAKPVQYQGQTEDVGNNNSSHGTQGDLGVADSSEKAPPFNPPVAGVVAPTKHSTLSRREKKPSNADHLQPAGTHTVKPLEYQGQPEDTVNNNLHGVQGVLGAQNSCECVSPSNPTVAVAPAERDDFSKRVAGAGAPANHRSSKSRTQLERKLSNADHLQPAGTNSAKAVKYQEQTVGVGHNDSSHGAQGELGAFNDFVDLPAYYPTNSVDPVQRAISSRQAQVEKKPSNAVHLQPAGTNNVKPFDLQGQGLQASSTAGISHYNSSNDAQVDLRVDNSSDCAPSILSDPRTCANLSRGPQAEQKPTNAYYYQLASSNNSKQPEDHGQGLPQGHRREGVRHMTSLNSMQGDFPSILKSMSTSPHNFQQPFVAGATSGGNQSNQAGCSRTSLLEHVQPQRPPVLTKASKTGIYDGQRQLVPVTQRQREDPKPANRGGQMVDYCRNCRVTSWENNELDIELFKMKQELSKMTQENQRLTLKLKQAEEYNEFLGKQISKYEQQHAQEIHRSGSYLDDSKAATPALLVSALNGVKDASNNFAKVFKAQVDSSPSTMQADVKHLIQDVGQVSRIGHMKFQYQAFVCQRLFEGFDHRNFDLFESTPGLPVPTVEHCFRQYQMHDFKKSDPVERLFQRHPEIDNFLNAYCFRKFSLIFNRQLEEQLFDGKHEHNDSIDKYEHPCNSRFYRSYCKLAVSIWLVHRLGFSFNQPAKLFRPRPGMRFNTLTMQSVVPLDSASDDEEVQLRVGFCIIPGMKVGESIVPSEVYVVGQ